MEERSDTADNPALSNTGDNPALRDKEDNSASRDTAVNPATSYTENISLVCNIFIVKFLVFSI